MKKINNKSKFIIIGLFSIFMLTTLSIPIKADESYGASIIPEEDPLDEESLELMLPEQEDNTNVDVENTDSMLGVDKDGNQVKIDEIENIIIEDINTLDNENIIKEETNQTNTKEENKQETNDNENTLPNQIISIDEEIPDSEKIKPKKENNVEIKDTIVEDLEQEIIYEKDVNNITKNQSNITLSIVIIIVLTLMIIIGIVFFIKKKK